MGVECYLKLFDNRLASKDFARRAQKSKLKICKDRLRTARSLAIAASRKPGIIDGCIASLAAMTDFWPGIGSTHLLRGISKRVIDEGTID